MYPPRKRQLFQRAPKLRADTSVRSNVGSRAGPMETLKGYFLTRASTRQQSNVSVCHLLHVCSPDRNRLSFGEHTCSKCHLLTASITPKWRRRWHVHATLNHDWSVDLHPQSPSCHARRSPRLATDGQQPFNIRTLPYPRDNPAKHTPLACLSFWNTQTIGRSGSPGQDMDLAPKAAPFVPHSVSTLHGNVVENG
jgi:hypothetical protein